MNTVTLYSRRKGQKFATVASVLPEEAESSMLCHCHGFFDLDLLWHEPAWDYAEAIGTCK